MDLVQFGANGTKTALVIDDERISYDELTARVETLASALQALSLGTGSRVGVLMHNSTAYVIAVLAAWKSHITLVPLSTRYQPAELKYVIGDAALDYVLIDSVRREGAPDLRGRLTHAIDDSDTAGRAPGIIELDDSGVSKVTLEARRSGEVEPFGDDELLLIYTSGTTANPKGCVHSGTQFIQTARATAATMQLTPEDVVWDPLPLFHTGGLLPMLGALTTGATYVTHHYFAASTALQSMEREGVTVAYPAFSTLITDLLDADEFDGSRLPKLRWMLAIGTRGLLERVQQELPQTVQVSCYGCTEIGGVLVYNSVEDSPEDRATTCGEPFEGVSVSILREDGTEAPIAESGEIVVKAPSLLRRYHGLDLAHLDDQGRFRTGDLGRILQNGQLVFEGRLKEMLKVGGENVAPSEIEVALASHPAVTMVQVVGAPDSRLEQVAAAFVELRPGTSVDEEELVQHCRERFASFKVPRHWRFVTTWPMSATKIQKTVLAQQIQDELMSAETAK